MISFFREIWENKHLVGKEMEIRYGFLGRKFTHAQHHSLCQKIFFLKILVFTKNKVESEAMDTLPVCPRTKLNIRHKNYSSNMA